MVVLHAQAQSQLPETPMRSSNEASKSEDVVQGRTHQQVDEVFAGVMLPRGILFTPAPGCIPGLCVMSLLLIDVVDSVCLRLTSSKQTIAGI